MKIYIGYTSASFLDAVSQVLRAQEEECQVESSTSFAEFFNRIKDQSFDLLLIDGDLLHRAPHALYSRIKSVSQRTPVIVTLYDHEQYSHPALSNDERIHFIIKKQGFLSSLPVKIKSILREKATGSQHDRGEVLMVEREQLKKNPASSQADTGYFVCDRRGRFLSASAFLQNLLKYAEEELTQLTLADIVIPAFHDNLYRTITTVSKNNSLGQMTAAVIDKFGGKQNVNLQFRILRDDLSKEFIGFRGQLSLSEQNVIDRKSTDAPYDLDQKNMISELVEIVQLSYSEPMPVVLKRIAEVICHIFNFNRSTIALLDRRKLVYSKQALAGFAGNEEMILEPRKMEVPADVIEKIFSDKQRIKVIYHSSTHMEAMGQIGSGNREMDSLIHTPAKWDKRDMVIINLMDSNHKSFGYISLEDPDSDSTPDKTTFYNFDLYSRLASMIIENTYRYSTLERKNRRLKQIMVNSNIFKLYQSLNELLKEVVWSVKFSLDFNMVALVLLSRKSGMLETKAVACEDKIKLTQVSELSFNLKDFSDLLRGNYRVGKSFLIRDEEPVFKHMKQIYYDASENGHFANGWPTWAVLLVPIKSREGKIIGFLILDDPGNCRMPTPDTVQTCEIIANQIAIAIDNRVMYIQAKEGHEKPIPVKPVVPVTPPPPVYETEESVETNEKENDFSGSGFKKLVERFLR
jgi:transcriptional regulator with GAF, ATPase, and Fis domain